MSLTKIKVGALADDAVTSEKLDTNIDIAGTLDVTGGTTFDGDVGIGCSNPWRPLSISTGGDRFHATGYSAGSGGGILVTNGDQDDYEPLHVYAEDTKIYTRDSAGNATEKLRISADGKVGLGCIPNSELVVSKSSEDQLHLISREAGVGGQIMTTNNGYTDFEPLGFVGEYIYFNTRNSQFVSAEKMRLDDTGMLTVKSDSGNNAHCHLLLLNTDQTSSGETGQTADIQFWFTDNVGGQYKGAKIGAYKAADWEGNDDYEAGLTFSTVTNTASFENAFTERMRIRNDGGYRYFASDTYEICSYKATNSSDQAWRFFSGATAIDTGTARAYIRGDGAYWFAGSDVSDKDLKENITNLGSGSLNLIKQLTPCTYNFKVSEGYTDEKRTGFIAQNVASVFGTSDGVATGTDGQKDMCVDYKGITAHLTVALQEAIAKIETLEAKVAALEAAN